MSPNPEALGDATTQKRCLLILKLMLTLTRGSTGPDALMLTQMRLIALVTALLLMLIQRLMLADSDALVDADSEADVALTQGTC